MSKLKSRKFLLAIASILFIVITDMLNIAIDKEAYFSIVATVIGYILAEGHIDAKREQAKGEQAQETDEYIKM